MLLAVLLSLVVVVPVFAMTLGIAWKYRADNSKAKYRPDWDGDRRAETIWWLVPLTLIIILSVITWNSAHALDPFRPLSSPNQPLHIQVIALQWKWLFIYPDQHIATVNYFEIPTDRPIAFEITSDAPMNSFWIPQLGGQIYAMSGMSTQLQLMANRVGDYRGVSANISGAGFSGMHFTAKARSSQSFYDWIASVQAGSNRLTQAGYTALAKPKPTQQTSSFSSVDGGIYNDVVMKYMVPTDSSTMGDMPGMGHP